MSWRGPSPLPVAMSSIGYVQSGAACGTTPRRRPAGTCTRCAPASPARPDHVRAAFRDHVIYDDGILGHDRAAMVAAHVPVIQADADHRAAA